MHGEFEVGEDFGFGVLGEFCAFCGCAFCLECFEDWFSYACLVCEEFLEVELLVGACCVCYDCGVRCFKWDFVGVDELKRVIFALDDGECAVVLEFAKV